MIIGVPKEIKEQEYRVALLPSALINSSNAATRCWSSATPGAGAGYPDADYEQAGATLVDSTRRRSRRPTWL